MGIASDGEWNSGCVGNIARRLIPLSPGASIAHAIEIMRANGVTAYPVVNGGLVVAMATLDGLSRYVSRDWDTGIDQARLSPILMTLSASMESDAEAKTIVLVEGTRYSEALECFEKSPGVSAIAVVNASGAYIGVLTRSDLLATRVSTLSPPRMGGMATPIGVYLTDGVNAGGAGFKGLVLTGICLGVLSILASAINFWIVQGIASHPKFNPLLGMMIWANRADPPDGARIVGELYHYISLPILLVLLRLLPLAGYHAAEHQVVHCAERGEVMTIPMVRSMPRVHPRCGTNLVAGLSVFGISICINTIMCGGIISAVVPSALITAFLWQPVGSFFQQYFTTRPASDKQIRSGIAAAEMLMANYRSDVSRKNNTWLRIWRMGLLQVLIGVCIVMMLTWALEMADPKLVNIFQF